MKAKLPMISLVCKLEGYPLVHKRNLDILEPYLLRLIQKLGEGSRPYALQSEIALCCTLWKATCEVSEERERVKECESDRTREISGQNKVFVQDMLKNEPLLPYTHTIL